MAGGWEEEEEEEEEGGSELQLLGNVCVCLCVCACMPVERGGPGLLMYSHIMLGSDPAAVSKMFEAQNIIFEKCSHRLAILFLERPDIWPFSFSPSPTSSPSSLLLTCFFFFFFGGGGGGGGVVMAGHCGTVKGKNYHPANCVGATLIL